MKFDWSQDSKYLHMAEKAIGVEFAGHPTYWLVVTSDEGNVRGVIVYCGFTSSSCEISIATFSHHHFTREVLRQIFMYPFQQLKLRRVHAFTRSDSKGAANQLSRLGFCVEGLLRNWYPDCHGILHGLLKEECKWL